VRLLVVRLLQAKRIFVLLSGRRVVNRSLAFALPALRRLLF
jgi:hypothetical protein